jgi:hypothetical protein
MRFKYLGEPKTGGVAQIGQTTVINIPKKNGQWLTLTPVSPSTAFAIEEDIGYDITEERALRYMQADSRFQEIV